MNRLLALAFVVSLVACSKDNAATSSVKSTETIAPPASTALPDPAMAVVGEPLLAYLSLARSMHTRATLLEKENRIAEALVELDGLVAATPPKGDYIEVREVRIDTYARLAELRMTIDPERASKDVAAGLELGPTGYFLGRMLEVSGIVDKARAKTSEEAGKIAEAKMQDLNANSVEAAMRIIEGTARSMGVMIGA